MNDMNAETKQSLINEAITNIDISELYGKAIDYADTIKFEIEGLDKETLIKLRFALGGFAAGIEFTLDNLEIIEKEENDE